MDCKSKNYSTLILFHTHDYMCRLLLPPAGQLIGVSQLDISPINNVIPKLGPIITHRLSMILMSKCLSL